MQQTNEEEEIALIPTTVSVVVRPGLDADPTETPYVRLLRLSRALAKQEKRADLDELTVQSDTNSIGSASLVFNLWAGTDGQP